MSERHRQRKTVQEVLRSVCFRPVNVVAVLSSDRDHFGRRLYRPVVNGQINGSTVRILLAGLGTFRLPSEAVTAGKVWCDEPGAGDFI